MELADEIVLGDASSEEAHAFRAEDGSARFEIESTFEGDEGAKALKAAGRRLEGPFEFKARIPTTNSGLRLRVAFDQEVGNRLIEVDVDGVRSAEWFRAGVNPRRGLREEYLEIPPRLSAGKGEVKIRLRPAPGPLAEFGYKIFAHRKD